MQIDVNTTGTELYMIISINEKKIETIQQLFLVKITHLSIKGMYLLRVTC